MDTQGDLLVFPLKKTPPVDFAGPLGRHIQATYHTSPDEYLNEFKRLDRLRLDATQAASSTSETTRTVSLLSICLMRRQGSSWSVFWGW